MSAPFLYDRLSYVALGTPKLEESIGFYRDLMGLELCSHQPDLHAVFRCSDSSADFVLFANDQPGLLRVGMKVKSHEDLDGAAEHLEQRGYQLAPLQIEQRELFGTGPGFSVQETGTGLTFDFFENVTNASTPFTPTLTNIQRLGHVVIRAKELDPVWATLRDDFNFVASDYVENKAVWLRCYPNPLHHSFAVVCDDNEGLHHINFMVSEIDDIGKARNRMANAGMDIVFGPGRHTPSGSVFLYFNDPVGMTMEFSYGMEEFPAKDAREPRQLENSAKVMDQWGGFPAPEFAKGGQIISKVAES
jgi:2,3-dihydroxy-p-cumate/2,3-dihydroxybenzoate 3,4-dioxygenase